MSWWTKKVPVTVCPPKQSPEVVSIESIGWISVTDKVPEYGVRVVVSSDFGVITGHRTSSDEKGEMWELGMRDTTNPYFTHYHAQSTRRVTHWMPLPPAPGCA